MTRAIRLTRTGGPDVLTLTSVERHPPGPHEVWIEHEAIGLNYLDVMQRRGDVPIPLPGGLGLEGAGRVTTVGAGVTRVAVGDRVAYALGPLGSYATGRLYPADRLIAVPAAIDLDVVAASLFKGLTAHYLIHDTVAVGPDTVVLLYGAAGGLGRILAAWARHRGACVVGVVSRAASAEAAREAGCAEVLVWGRDDLPQCLQQAAGRKADVVYDGVGRDTFATSLDCLRPRGTLVSIGASSGAPPAVELATLNAKGSLFVTRPGLAAHIADAAEYRRRAAAVFEALQAGVIPARPAQVHALADAAAAHAALERGGTGGSLILKP